MKGRNKLLLIFIHGFKGDDKTFQDFPEHLQSVLTESILDIDTKSIIYERYETRGDFKKAVDLFCSWLEGKVCDYSDEGGDVWVILLGHSMGGILAADTILNYANQKDTTSSPNIIGLLAFDTPFYGLHKNISDSATKRANQLRQDANSTYTLLTTAATTSGFLSSSKKKSTSESSGWGKFGLLAGVGAALGTATAAYYYKDHVTDSFKWLKSHYDYVTILDNPTELSERVENLVNLPNISFHCYYTQIPKEKTEETFILLPSQLQPKAQHMMPYFSAVIISGDGIDVIDAHTCMFDPDKNTSYFDLSHNSLDLLNKIVYNYKKLNESK